MNYTKRKSDNFYLKKNKMKFFLVLFIAFLGMLSVKCQTINIELKHFPAKDYMYLIVHGNKFDTVAHGKMDKAGKANLVFKDKFKNYKGMSRFIFSDGSGFDFIVNRENFRILSTKEVLNGENIQFINSPENEYLKSQSIQKQKLLQKEQLASAVLALYNEKDTLYTVFKEEQQHLNEQYKTLKNLNEKKSLYAARMMEIFDFLIGNSDDLHDDVDKKITQANNFVISKLNMDDLYNSMYWNDVLNNWFNLQLQLNKDDAELFTNLQQLAVRMKSNVQYTSFAEIMVKQLAKIGKDGLVSTFGAYIAKSGKIEQPDHYLLAAMGGPQIGMAAPDLLYASGKNVFNKNQKTILIFYETGCNNCDNEINLLIGNYQELQKKGYEVVSAASDVDVAEHEKNAGRFPWKKKFSDYKGPGGVNFTSYGVIGTPTIFIIDEKGIITGRYARIADANILN